MHETFLDALSSNKLYFFKGWLRRHFRMIYTTDKWITCHFAALKALKWLVDSNNITKRVVKAKTIETVFRYIVISKKYDYV